ncbi:MAG: copper resistance protein NlpE N-terminal domain-containing protein [Bacteroidaceae bacterium]|nr:copper resistance protein NlpE N-terminal domain-containing protein [Bacteroidaceae bacterium]MBR6600674.1 copper resistance protein NlpE N-terminal domain-containing protein [Bacteroidaceae bacterium]
MEKTMKKTLTLAAIVCLAAFAVSCGNKKRVEPAVAIEAYSDSIYMINDSTVGDLQTYVYEGVLPTDAGIPANYVLTINSYGLNADGTYSLTESYTETNGKVSTNYDEGQKIVMVGIPNDSTAVVYELVSYSNRPKMRLVAEGDSALHKVDKELKRVSQNVKHKLHRK